MRRLDAALELSREAELHDAPVAPFKALLTRISVGAALRRRRAAARQGASRIFLVSGCPSADEHERLLCNRRFHPFNVYTENKRREKLNCNNPVRSGHVRNDGIRRDNVAPWKGKASAPPPPRTRRVGPLGPEAILPQGLKPAVISRFPWRG